MIINPSYNIDIFLRFKCSLWTTPNENKNIKSAKYYAFDLPDEEVVEKVERMRRAVTKNYGMIKLPSCLDRLSLLGLRECNGSSYVLQQSKKHLGMVQCTFVVFFLTFFFPGYMWSFVEQIGQKSLLWTHNLFWSLVFSWNISNFKKHWKLYWLSLKRSESLKLNICLVLS